MEVSRRWNVLAATPQSLFLGGTQGTMALDCIETQIILLKSANLDKWPSPRDLDIVCFGYESLDGLVMAGS